MMQLVTAEDLKMLKRASIPQVMGWATRLYRQGVADGVKEAEKEFEDAIIMTVDEAIERIGQENFDKLVT